MFDNGDNRGPWVGHRSSTIGFLNDADRYFFPTPDDFLLRESPAPTTDTLVATTRSGGLTTVFEDGLPVIASAAGPSGELLVNAVGIYASNRTFFGEISAILLYDRALSPMELNAVGDFLAAQYGLETAYIPAAVPEPGTCLLLGTGVLSLLGYRWRQQRKKATGLWRGSRPASQGTPPRG